MNVQFAIQKRATVYVLEVNPRASRTVPFVSKATGLPLAKIAARCMAGKTLARAGRRAEVIPPYYSVKEAVFPFVKFPGVDTILGPEMKSTGEVMGVGRRFGEAFVKSQLAAGDAAADGGQGVHQRARRRQAARGGGRARRCVELGFRLVATRGTAAALAAAGLPVTPVNKVAEGRPHIVDMIKNGEIALIVNTVEDRARRFATRARSARAALQQRDHLFHHDRRRARRLHRHEASRGAARHTACRTSMRSLLAAADTLRCMTKIPMTVNGATKLRAELQQLKAVERPAIITAIAEARAHGDLSENAEYARGARSGRASSKAASGDREQARQRADHRSRAARRRRPLRVRRDRRTRGPTTART